MKKRHVTGLEKGLDRVYEDLRLLGLLIKILHNS